MILNNWMTYVYFIWLTHVSPFHALCHLKSNTYFVHWNKCLFNFFFRISSFLLFESCELCTICIFKLLPSRVVNSYGPFIQRGLKSHYCPFIQRGLKSHYCPFIQRGLKWHYCPLQSFVIWINICFNQKKKKKSIFGKLYTFLKASMSLNEKKNVKQ